MKRVDIQKKRSRYSMLHTMVLLGVVAAVAAGCSPPGGGPAGPAEAQLATRPVKTEPVARQSIGAPVEQVADVVSGTTVDIVPKVGGTVVELVKKRGDYVHKDEVLLRLDSVDAESVRRKNELSVRSAEESLKKAKDDQANNRKDLADSVTKAEMAFKNAEQDYNKLRNDYEDGKATNHQLDQAKQQVDTARMSLESAKNKLAANDNSNTIASYETQLETARLALEDSIRTLENYSVKAPASGLLTDFTPVVGQTISSGKIGQIQQVDPIKITTELSETNYQLVKNKQELVYYNPDTPETKGTAKISYLAPVMSAQTKTFTLELEIANPNLEIQPGKRYMVQLTTETEQKVPVVPALSIIREESDSYVFILKDGTYQKRKVKLGRINGQYQEIAGGVNEGEQLVVSGQHQLKDGQKADEPAKSGTGGSAADTKPVK
ncbi:efflux RND transporter periplasmic adaptor subunit [Paenibacillus hamazuiensis]|uniref:efflux RND transporter periplasmic adaptor subunit n=1 Tax=Paenibacillus hamazuiensis TaxID=2936508 RepID=UPI00200D9CDE|nr:efflux RND transporter periplasmic adaptor subunit [Paenibacillus hamazuiensis]